MVAEEHDSRQLRDMRSSFEAGLPSRIHRASRVKLQNIIPAHWFTAAASECAGMYIAGFFYGTISVAQAYVEALSRFLAEHHHTRIPKDPGEQCQCLHREKVISDQALKAALAILNGRNDFHHLNKQVEQEYKKLETRAEDCVNQLHTIESEIFAYSFGDEPGKVTLKKPEYWPSGGHELAQVSLRKLW